MLLLPLEKIIMNTMGQVHLLAQEGHLPLAMWPESGKTSNLGDFQKLLTSFANCGGSPQNPHIPVSGECGQAGVAGGVLISFWSNSKQENSTEPLTVYIQLSQ